MTNSFDARLTDSTMRQVNLMLQKDGFTALTNNMTGVQGGQKREILLSDSTHTSIRV